MKEEPTPYRGADSLKQIPVLFYFSSNLPDFNLQNLHGAHLLSAHPYLLARVHKISCVISEGLLHVGFSLSDAVAALHFANVVKVSDKPKLFRKKSCLAPLFSFAALVANVSISVDALAMLFGCHVDRNVAVVHGCDNELMEAKVHKVG